MYYAIQKLHLDVQMGEHTIERNTDTTKDNMQTLENGLSHLIDQMVYIIRQQEYQRVKEKYFHWLLFTLNLNWPFGTRKISCIFLFFSSHLGERRGVSWDQRGHQQQSVVVGSGADLPSAVSRVLADETTQRLLCCQEACLTMASWPLTCQQSSPYCFVHISSQSLVL